MRSPFDWSCYALILSDYVTNQDGAELSGRGWFGPVVIAVDAQAMGRCAIGNAEAQGVDAAHKTRKQPGVFDQYPAALPYPVVCRYGKAGHGNAVEVQLDFGTPI